jgi:hypothetical protein
MQLVLLVLSLQAFECEVVHLHLFLPGLSTLVCNTVLGHLLPSAR